MAYIQEAYIWGNISEGLYSVAYTEGTYILGLVPGLITAGLISVGLISGDLYPGGIISVGLIFGGSYPVAYIQGLLSEG